MPLYRFECDSCGTQDMKQMTFAEHDDYRERHPRGHVAPHSGCVTGIFKQVMDFHYARPMPEHYSDQLDTVVKSERHFNDTLKRQAEEYTARTGMEVSYDTIDPTDPKAAGVTDAGMEATERAHHAEKSDGHKSVFS